MDYIVKGSHKYYKANCIQCGSGRGYIRKHLLHKLCRSCSSKKSIEKYGNPMSGKRHSNTAKFRKCSYSHYDYEDRQVLINKSGNKSIRYRKKCPQCGIDMGYHRQVDSHRVCVPCQNDNLRKYTPEQKRLRCAMKANISCRLRRRNSGKNYTSTFSMLPYSFEELVDHLESKFQPGMTWDNYSVGGWEIDHTRPDSSFNYESYNDTAFLQSWSLKNLQPMWAKENRSKSSKWGQ